MKKFVSLAAFLLLAASFAGAKDFDASVKTALEARYKDLRIAMAARDVVSVGTLLAPGFVSEDVSGNRQDADSMLREVAALKADPNKVSETTVVSVESDGDSVVAVQRYHMTTIKADRDGSPKHVDLVTISRDTWKRPPKGTWLISKTVTQQIDYKVNDKLLVHKERAGQ
jgi:hypothetical protein